MYINYKLKTLHSYLFKRLNNKLNEENGAPLNKAPYRGAFLGGLFLTYKKKKLRVVSS
jgi:hypothetical protein